MFSNMKRIINTKAFVILLLIQKLTFIIHYFIQWEFSLADTHNKMNKVAQTQRHRHNIFSSVEGMKVIAYAIKEH